MVFPVHNTPGRGERGEEGGFAGVGSELLLNVVRRDGATLGWLGMETLHCVQ